MDEDYKGHHIHSTARPILESGRWVPHLIITWTSGSREEIREFDGQARVCNENEAEQAGVTFAKQWIEDGKPRTR
jgi:hypothetical protein